MRKRRLLAAFLVLPVFLCGFAFSPGPPLPGKQYFSWHAVLTFRGFGTKLSRFRDTGQLYISNIGSDGESHADRTVTFFSYIPRDGFYNVQVDFVSGSSDRYFELAVNGDVHTIPCPDGSWDKVTSTTVLLPLRKGINKLRFGNAAWFAPALFKVRITEPEHTEPPETGRKERDMEDFTYGNIALSLDKANGTYDLTQDGRLLLRNAFAAADFEGTRLYTQEYDTHAITKDGDDILFAHTKQGSPNLIQRFSFRDDGLLASVAMVRPEGVTTAWISPLYTADDNSLRGGTQFLQVPFDNDNFDSYKRASVTSVNTSHEMTALLNKDTGSAVVIGSVTHDTWKTGLEWRGMFGKVKRFCAYGGMTDKQTRDSQPHGAVSGQSVVSPTIFIGSFGAWQEGLDAYGKANADIAPPLEWDGGPIMGWSSWGVVQDSLTDEIAFAASDYYKENFQEWVEEDEGVLYINLDAWWNEAFGRSVEGLRRFVDHCEANGQKAGVYHTPFACWEWQLEDKTLMGTDGKSYHMNETVLHGVDGSMPPTWDSAYPFDVTHPAVTQMIEEDIQRFIDAGFSYVKLDFMSHGAMEGKHFDESVQTGIQAYNQEMARIVDQIGGRMFINLSIAPIFPHQFANGRRIACDTFYSAGNSKYMLNSLTFGFWQRNIYACPDPDHIVVWGKEGKAEEGEARLRVTTGAIMSSFLAGDNFAAVSPEAQARFDLVLKNKDIMALARKGKTFVPAHLPAGDSANIYTLQDGGVTYIAVCNFDLLKKSFDLDLQALTGAGQTQVKELWSGAEMQAGEVLVVTVNGHDAKVFAVVPA